MAQSGTTLLSRIGARIPGSWEVDATHLLALSNGGWNVLLLAYDTETREAIVTEVWGETFVRTVRDADRERVRVQYVNRVAARLFDGLNTRAPALTFERKNEESL